LPDALERQGLSLNSWASEGFFPERRHYGIFQNCSRGVGKSGEIKI